jgi:hypothetical protein
MKGPCHEISRSIFNVKRAPVKILNKPINENNLFSKFFIWKAWRKLDVGEKKLNILFYVDIFIYHEDIRVLKIVDFFYSEHLSTVTGDNLCTMLSPEHKKFRRLEYLTCVIA